MPILVESCSYMLCIIKPHQRVHMIKYRFMLMLAVTSGCMSMEPHKRSLKAPKRDRKSQRIDNSSSQETYDSIHTAASAGNVGAVRKFLAEGTSPDAQDRYGWQPLPIAVIMDREAIVRMLIEHGAPLYVACFGGVTPLHYAALRGHEAVTRVLIENGADVDVPDFNFKTSLDIAVKKGQLCVAIILLAAGGTIKNREKLIHRYRAKPLIQLLLGKSEEEFRQFLQNPEYTFSDTELIEAFRIAFGQKLNEHAHHIGNVLGNRNPALYGQAISDLLRDAIKSGRREIVEAIFARGVTPQAVDAALAFLVTPRRPRSESIEAYYQELMIRLNAIQMLHSEACNPASRFSTLPRDVVNCVITPMLCMPAL